MALETEFDLKSETVFSSIPEPEHAEPVSDDLCKATLKTRCGNPADRGTEDFESFFEYAEGDVNYTEYFGALQALIPCIDLSGKHLQEMERILLKWIGDYNIHLKWPVCWEKVSDHFEQVLKNLWLDNSGGGRGVFVRGHINQLAIFCDKGMLLSLEDALDADEDS